MHLHSLFFIHWMKAKNHSRRHHQAHSHFKLGRIYMTLLLNIIIKKTNPTFKHYKLVTSKFQRMKDLTETLIHLELFLGLLKDLLCNDGPISISSFDLQMSLLIEASASQRISNKIIKPNSNGSFSLGSINQPLLSIKKECNHIIVTP